MAMFVGLLLAVIAGNDAVQALPLSVCGSDHPSKVIDCDKPDLGSCGNACCVAELTVPNSEPATVYGSLKSALLTLDDYEFVGGDDLSQYNITKPEPFRFIAQGRHSAPKYSGESADILNFAIFPDAWQGSTVRMFSVSRIHGALGDNGQNYKTLAFLSKKFAGGAELAVRYGCGMQETAASEHDLPRLQTEGLATPPSVCGSDPSKVVDCDKPDLGSCGNACCIAELAFPQTEPASAFASLKSLLSTLGSDGYEFVGGADLTPYNITKPELFKFVAQGRHSAPKYSGANADILNFAIYEDASGGSVIRMFSLSRIHGALGDHGQNYKSISYMKHHFTPEGKVTVKYGCGDTRDMATAEVLL
eukprot:TRINITY_DN26217_c0_g1_i1.p1 TRINITY_DN26217_c0_g1~~TRINITY_DN26217_c0_g1_i1.p1  ORF type:complete len:362 (-),score=67.14 TRINITY_DN26217_c0_g1_i1:229-1314(-)